MCPCQGLCVWGRWLLILNCYHCKNGVFRTFPQRTKTRTCESALYSWIFNYSSYHWKLYRRLLGILYSIAYLLDRFLFSFHDIWKSCIARLVQPEISTQYGRQFHLYRLKATVDFSQNRQLTIRLLDLVKRPSISTGRKLKWKFLLKLRKKKLNQNRRQNTN